MGYSQISHTLFNVGIFTIAHPGDADIVCGYFGREVSYNILVAHAHAGGKGHCMIAVVIVAWEGDVGVGVNPYDTYISTILFGQICEYRCADRTLTSKSDNFIRICNGQGFKGCL